MAKKKSMNDGAELFRSMPFSILVKHNSELAKVRREYSSSSAEERRKAADWAYYSQMTTELFNRSLALSGQDGLGEPDWPSGFVALAIDPLYAPALLTVGSIECHFGRIDEAMKLFIRLTELPKDEEDLSIIIDKAGDFLIDQDDYANALALYFVAERAYPHEAVYAIGAGYCLGKPGRYEESIEKHRRADALEPNNYKHLNDLGYSLFEAGRYDEAEEVL